MKTTKFFVTILCSLILCMINLNAFDCQADLFALMEKDDMAITGNNKTNLFLNFERLTFSEEGVYLQDDTGIFHVVNNLSYENGQYYVQRIKEYKCNKCGAQYYGSHPSVCTACKTSTSFSEITTCSTPGS